MFLKKKLTPEQEMKKYIGSLIKDYIYYDDDLYYWYEAYDFINVKKAAVDKLNNVLILIYTDNKMEIIDLDSLDCFEYTYEIKLETTLI